MDEMLKMMFQMAMQDAMKNGFKPNGAATHKTHEQNINEEAKKLAKENMILFNAHVEAGFTAEQAIVIVAAINN